MATSKAHITTTLGTHALVLSLCILMAVVVCWKTITDGLMYCSDDIWWHLFWLQDFVSELKEGVLYPRWLASNDFNYGGPVLVFYPPLTFYVGALIQTLFSVAPLKMPTVMFTVGSAMNGFVYYLMVRKRWGIIPAASGSLILITCAYFAIDIYCRGALPELCALCWLPVIMFSVDRVDTRMGRLRLAAGFFLLLMTHLPSFVIFSLCWLTRVGFCSIGTESGIKRFSQNIVSAGLGVGCAGFFLLPMLLEQRYVDVAFLFDKKPWTHNLIGWNIFWGLAQIPETIYRSSAAALIFFVILLILLAVKKSDRAMKREVYYWFGLGLATLLLMSQLSSFLWNHVKLLQMLQFPWRVMSVNSFCLAVLVTLCLKEVQAVRPSTTDTVEAVETVGEKAKVGNVAGKNVSRAAKISVYALTFLLLGLNIQHGHAISAAYPGFDRPAHKEPINLASAKPLDKAQQLAMQHMHEALSWMLKHKDGYPGAPEHRPLVGIDADIFKRGSAHKKSISPAAYSPDFSFVSGSGSIMPLKRTAYDRIFAIRSENGLKVVSRTFYYPGWHLYKDTQEQKIEQTDDGTILVSADAGEHTYELKYEDTTAFRLGLLLSALSLVAFVVINRPGVRSSE